jgi:hypothetical protein
MRSGNDTAVRARVARGLTAVPAITLAALAVGCGSTTPGTATAARPTASLPLGTAVSATGATWTVLPMGVPRGHNLFWQLFVLPAGGRQWKLATPPDVDTNGAFAVSVTGAQSLAAGVRPSQLLRFSPVSSTANGGRTWLAGPPDPGLAEVPDALAAAPQGGQLLALDRTGRVEQGRTGWTTLTSLRRLAATSAARSCAPAALTAVAFSPSGPPVVAARCARPGSAGIFAEQGGHWSAAGPTLPGALSGQRIGCCGWSGRAAGSPRCSSPGRGRPPGGWSPGRRPTAGGRYRRRCRVRGRCCPAPSARAARSWSS